MGVKDHIDDSEFCYVAGYTYYLHGYYINEADDEEEEGRKLIRRCSELSENESLKALANNFNKKHSKWKKYERMENAKEICAELFPSDSILDEYFRTIIIR